MITKAVNENTWCLCGIGFYVYSRFSMMKVLLKSALIYDPTSEHHGKKRDVLLQGNRVVSISSEIQDTRAKLIQAKGFVLSRGWTDIAARSGEPGAEYKEDLNSLKDAARRGGYTRVAILPSTLPVVDNKSAIHFINNHSEPSIQLLPIGALSQKMEGKQLAEMFDMQQAGAKAFSDDRGTIGTELMCRALEYSRNLGSIIMVLPWDRGLNGNGQMHEGPVSVSLGMKGIPHLAEEIRVQRDIELLRYCGGRLHFMLISTARSVELIRKAKRDGLHVSCAVAAHQLLFTDEHLTGFDSNYKVIPPFRSKDDRKALIAGLKDGTIDAIVSDHCPEDVEHKVREFEDANFGISSIEASFCTAFTALEKHMSPEEIIEKFTSGPETILGLSPQPVSEGSHVSILHPESNTEFTSATWMSKSKNSPVIGMSLRGEVY
jgi:dihydroorotase